ncbi:hypothetical protein M0805_009623 [Coniferiporia weirii]|nr:hypothetical protein M0805_009623 [Coniferiporia weirii]
MGAYYDEVEIEDMVWDEARGVFHYPCPCGDRFEISRAQLARYEDIATCPSCSLVIRVVYDPLDFEDDAEEDDAESEPESESEPEDASEPDPATQAEPEHKKDADDSDEDSHFEDALERLHISDAGADAEATAMRQ